MTTFRSLGTCALLVAHPGHEMVVHGLVEKARPLVAMLTDGSGASGRSRVESSSTLLAAAGASQAALFGRYSDAQCYAALLRGDAAFFVEIAESVAAVLAGHGIDTAIVDAEEGWNPIHDIWHRTVEAACELVRLRKGHRIQRFDFLLFQAHTIEAPPQGSIVLSLDQDGYQRKLEAAAAYEELQIEVSAALRGSRAGLIRCPELSDELEVPVEGWTAEAYGTEVLRPSGSGSPLPATKPVYEIYGERLVSQGRYEEVIRRERHLLPIENALWRYAEAERRRAAVATAPGRGRGIALRS